MTNEPSPQTAGNPFAALLAPDESLAAHARLAARVRATIHRPLDRFGLQAGRADNTATDDYDDDFDLE